MGKKCKISDSDLDSDASDSDSDLDAEDSVLVLDLEGVDSTATLSILQVQHVQKINQDLLWGTNI